ncbi:MAG: hypothetical protein SCH98_00490 [Deferrisomatales bacterium]|nr:hypothetical protein [Deferrisomatales bacterium]
MKCPKCKYTSFDHLEACKRCGADLRDARSLLQVICVPPEERAPVAPAPSPGSERQDVDPSAHTDRAGLTPDILVSEEAAPREPLDFDESFDVLVERTSYEEEGTKPAQEETEELLDLDFGDLFGEEERKK